MQQLILKQVDAFTTQPFGGNPAGVISDADSLSSEDMLRIAGEMNLAETAFVTTPSTPEATFRLRFFTPTGEVGLSGHVTIASCYSLIEDGRIPVNGPVTVVNFETNVGIVPVEIHSRENEDGLSPGTYIKINAADGNKVIIRKIMMQTTISSFKESPISISELSGILKVDPIEISGTGLPVEIMSTGLDQLIIPVRSKETILDLNPDLIKLSLLNRKYGVDTNHIFSLDTWAEDCISYARHFAPAVGMWEDPATGTASAGLGTYLYRHGVATNKSMVMEQGKEKDAMARILVELKDPESGSGLVQIGGLSVTSITRRIEVSDGAITIG